MRPAGANRGQGRAIVGRVGEAAGLLTRVASSLSPKGGSKTHLYSSRMPPFTNGFRDAGELRRHFFKHGARLGCHSNQHYEHLADVFLGGPIVDDVAEFMRPGGDRVRYNQTTQEFGAITATGTIRTYFILTGSPVRNRVYFCEKCK